MVEKETNYFEFKSQLIEKYNESYVNSMVNKACTFMILGENFLRIPDNLSIEEEENVFYNYISGTSTPKCKTKRNILQENFLQNCCDEIVKENLETPFFKDKDISNPDSRFDALTVAGMLGLEMAKDDKVKIANKYTLHDLQEDLFYLYFKRYSLYRRDPNNQLFQINLNVPAKNINSNKKGCLTFFLLLAIPLILSLLLHT